MPQAPGITVTALERVISGIHDDVRAKTTQTS